MATVGEEVDNDGARQLSAAGYGDRLTGLLVAEPGNSNVDAAERGIIDYTLTAHGKAAHSSRPDLGGERHSWVVCICECSANCNSAVAGKRGPHSWSCHA